MMLGKDTKHFMIHLVLHKLSFSKYDDALSLLKWLELEFPLEKNIKILLAYVLLMKKKYSESHALLQKIDTKDIEDTSKTFVVMMKKRLSKNMKVTKKEKTNKKLVTAGVNR